MMHESNECGIDVYKRQLQGKTLGCFCKPDPCHGDIIKEYLDWMAENANEAIVIGQIHWKGCVLSLIHI